MSKIEIIISEGRIVDLCSDKDAKVTVFIYDKVKNGILKKKNDLIAIEVHDVKGNKSVGLGISNEI